MLKKNDQKIRFVYRFIQFVKMLEGSINKLNKQTRINTKKECLYCGHKYKFHYINRRIINLE